MINEADVGPIQSRSIFMGLLQSDIARLQIFQRPSFGLLSYARPFVFCTVFFNPHRLLPSLRLLMFSSQMTKMLLITGHHHRLQASSAFVIQRQINRN